MNESKPTSGWNEAKPSFPATPENNPRYVPAHLTPDELFRFAQDAAERIVQVERERDEANQRLSKHRAGFHAALRASGLRAIAQGLPLYDGDTEQVASECLNVAADRIEELERERDEARQELAKTNEYVESEHIAAWKEILKAIEAYLPDHNNWDSGSLSQRVVLVIRELAKARAWKAKATNLLRERMGEHENPGDGSYNQCETDPCAWCKEARKLLEETE